VPDEQHRGSPVPAASSSAASRSSKPPLSGSCTTGSPPSSAQTSRAVSSARTRGLVKTRSKLDAQPRERATGGARLLLAARRQAALEVRPGAVRLRVAMPQQPEYPCHSCEPIA
jgi:hypothetical protein